MRVAFISLSIAAALALGACSSAKETLGLTKQAPDEFAVVKRAPLSMPPDYSLRPPRPGEPRPQELEPSLEARQAIFGVGSTAGNAQYYSEGESILLRDAGVGAAETDPAIRKTVDAETKETVDANQPVVDKLLNYTGMGASGASAEVVDPIAEAERLKKNRQEGKPVTEGETPTLNN